MRSCILRPWSQQLPHQQLRPCSAWPQKRSAHVRIYHRRLNVLHNASTTSISDNQTLAVSKQSRIVAQASGRPNDRDKHPGNILKALSPEAAKRNDPRSWAAVVEPFLPDHLRKKDVARTDKPTTIVPDIIARAWQESNIDILNYMGQIEKRWDVFAWLAFHIIETSDAPNIYWGIPQVTTSIEWPADQKLNVFTNNPVSLGEIRSGTSEMFRPYQSPNRRRDSRPLNEILKPYVHHTPSRSAFRARLLLGQLWVFLGRTIIAAATENPDQSNDVTSLVVALLWKLHRKGFIPKDIFKEYNHEDDAALQQPPLVSHLSRAFLLSTHSKSATSEASLLDMQRFAETQRNVLATSPPRPWLEYLLWCCVHGGWLMEGSLLVEEIRRAKGGWRLINWRASTSTTIPPELVDTHLQIVPGSNEAKVENVESAVARTISIEVVDALADGLTQMMQDKATGAAISPAEIVKRLHGLRRCLDREKLGLGTSSWDSLITRIANSPVARDIHSSAPWLESVLNLAETYSYEGRVRNSPLHKPGTSNNRLGSHHSHTSAGSAAVLGLYHRLLHAYIRAKDVSGALRILGSLQRFTDTNKQESLKEFFRELKSIEVQHSTSQEVGLMSTKGPLPGVQYPGYFPNVPLDLLADLLDLLHDCDAMDLSRWLIYSSDIDGPLIPEEAYGNQAIAPALIRFAASTLDTELLRRLMRAQTTAVSGHTLVALCESRIMQGNFDGAVDVFRLMRDFALYKWEAEDFARILRALLLGIYGRENMRELSHSHSQQASELCQKLLRGDLGQVWGSSFTRLDSIVQILSNADEHLAQLCSNLMPRTQQYAVDLSTQSFDLILEGAVKVWGSAKGKEMWELWCRHSVRRPLKLTGYSVGDSISRLPPSVAAEFSTVPTPSSSADERDGHDEVSEYTGHISRSPQRPRSVAAEFSAAPTMPSSSADEGDWNDEIFEYVGHIEPTMASVRIIIQQARQEIREAEAAVDGLQGSQDREQKQEVAFAARETLDWAANVLRSEFGLDHAGVDYELSLGNEPESTAGTEREEDDRREDELFDELGGEEEKEDRRLLIK